MKRHSRIVNHAGFTLVELVTTIAIVAVLVGLLLPALGRARESGRRVKCLSNMHQLSVGMLIYASENNGFLSPYVYAAQATNSGWNLSIKPNWSMADLGMPDRQNVLLCPTDKSPAVINTTDPTGETISVRTSYGYNFEPFIQHFSMARIGFSKTVLLFDGDPSGAFTNQWNGAPATDSCPSCGPNGKVLVCHNGNQTLCVADPSLAAHFDHGDTCGPCTGGSVVGDLNQLNAFVLKRRHSDKANVIFIDGHGEWLYSLPSGSLQADAQ